MKPCVLALAASRLPARKWTTRAELVERLEAARGLLQGDVQGKLSIPWLADQVFLSQAHFVQIFRETYGRSPASYRAQCRLAHAKDLLSRGANPTQAAILIGRYSASSFSRDFKHEFGVRPSDIPKIQD